MTNKKKSIIIFVSLLLFVLITSTWLFVLYTSDISDEKLGPSPFKIADSFVEDNNVETQEILKIGRTIVGLKGFDGDHSGDVEESPQEFILRLKTLLQKNKYTLDQVKLDLFLNCKFSNPKLFVDYNPFQDLLKLMNRKVNYEILINDFDNAKTDLITINKINNNLIEKCPSIILCLVIIGNKLHELHNLELIINHEKATIEQKLSILDVEPAIISNQVFIPIGYYTDDVIKKLVKDVSTSPLKIRDYSTFPFVKSYLLQPNNTLKLNRTFLLKIISEIEKPNFNINTDLEKKISWHPTSEKYYTPNYYGNQIIYNTIRIYAITANKILKYNHFCDRLKLIKELLLYKKRTGALPPTLEDLKLDKKFITDIFTDAPFLYSAENGILQSVGNNKKNDNIDLTTKKLTSEEIKAANLAKDHSDDMIFFLK